jgi:MtN3 and saliva related transmembrane protein
MPERVSFPAWGRTSLDYSMEGSETMEINELLGISAGMLTSYSRVPQIVKTWKTRSAAGLASGMYIMICTGSVLWLIYGVVTGRLAIILASAVSLASNVILLVFRFRFGKAGNK